MSENLYENYNSMKLTFI